MPMRVEWMSEFRRRRGRPSKREISPASGTLLAACTGKAGTRRARAAHFQCVRLPPRWRIAPGGHMPLPHLPAGQPTSAPARSVRLYNGPQSYDRRLIPRQSADSTGEPCDGPVFVRHVGAAVPTRRCGTRARSCARSPLGAHLAGRSTRRGQLIDSAGARRRVRRKTG